ncbi:IS5 family transposase [Wenjunlia vitaminophila]|uniref:IS5 family transposase n=1 Tax=Wenjunlia vitaminophila TaxID=76728 RepID=UPI003969DAE8
MTDESWAVIGPLLAPPRMGRPVRDRRQVVNGILWKLSTGAAWRDLPERYGPWKTVYERFRRWSADGTWDRLLAHVQQHSDAVGGVDWSVVCVDSTTCGPISTCRRPRKEPCRRAIGRSAGD